MTKPKEELKFNDTVKFNFELSKIDCHNLEMIIRSQIDRNNMNMLDSLAEKDYDAVDRYKHDNEYIQKLIKKIF